MRLLRRWLWLLAFALVAAQTLGLMHRQVHSAPRAESAQPARDARAPWLAALFAGHDDDAACLVFDQLSHADLMPALPALALPAVLPAALLPVLQGEALARWAALFDARGPPAIR